MGNEELETWRAVENTAKEGKSYLVIDVMEMNMADFAAMVDSRFGPPQKKKINREKCTKNLKIISLLSAKT